MIQIGLLVLAAVAALSFFHHYEGLVKDNATAATTIQTCANDKEGLKTAITTQNVASKKAIEEERARTAAALKAQDAAKKEADGHRQTALELLGRQLPEGANACEAARDLVRDYAKGRKK